MTNLCSFTVLPLLQKHGSKRGVTALPQAARRHGTQHGTLLYGLIDVRASRRVTAARCEALHLRKARDDLPRRHRRPERADLRASQRAYVRQYP